MSINTTPLTDNKEPTTKTINGQTFTLFQLVEHQVAESAEPIHIEVDGFVRDHIYNQKLHWVVTSVKDGLRLEAPDFGNEVLYYTDEQMAAGDVDITPKEAVDGTPIFAY